MLNHLDLASSHCLWLHLFLLGWVTLRYLAFPPLDCFLRTGDRSDWGLFALQWSCSPKPQTKLCFPSWRNNVRAVGDPHPTVKPSSRSCCEDDRLQPGANPWEQRFGGQRLALSHWKSSICWREWGAFTLAPAHRLSSKYAFHMEIPAKWRFLALAGMSAMARDTKDFYHWIYVTQRKRFVLCWLL